MGRFKWRGNGNTSRWERIDFCPGLGALSTSKKAKNRHQLRRVPLKPVQVLNETG